MNDLIHDIDLLEEVIRNIKDGNNSQAATQLLQIINVKQVQFELAEKEMEAG